MFNKNRNTDRQGFYRYLDVFRRAEKDKDAFCRAARITRGGGDIFNNLDGIIRELTNQRARGNLLCSEYQQALDRVRAIITEQNAHELRMAEIAAGVKKSEKE